LHENVRDPKGRLYDEELAHFHKEYARLGLKEWGMLRPPQDFSLRVRVYFSYVADPVAWKQRHVPEERRDDFEYLLFIYLSQTVHKLTHELFLNRARYLHNDVLEVIASRFDSWSTATHSRNYRDDQELALVRAGLDQFLCEEVIKNWSDLHRIVTWLLLAYDAMVGKGQVRAAVWYLANVIVAIGHAWNQEFTGSKLTQQAGIRSYWHTIRFRIYSNAQDKLFALTSLVPGGP